MKDTKIFLVIFLSFFISFSNCIEEILHYFNVTKIEPRENACNTKEGKYHFNIICDFDEAFTGTYITYVFLDTPANGDAICIPRDYFGFSCYVDLIDYPLNEKKILLSKEQPFSYYKYNFNNWEKYITEHHTLSENIKCTPSIRNIFIYSSVEKDVNSFIIKGEWSNKSESFIPEYAVSFILKIQNSITSEVNCKFNVTIKTECNCTFKGDEIPSFEDQIVRNSDNYVYKIEKKTDDEDEDKTETSYIIVNMLLILLILLFL